MQLLRGNQTVTGELAEYGEQLLANGYAITPIKPGTKKPALPGWTSITVTLDKLRELLAGAHRAAGVGLVTGKLRAVDIDVLDPWIAEEVQALAEALLGTTLVRTGAAPKCALLYRAADASIPKRSTAKWRCEVSGQEHRVEVLGVGQQLVAFGTHPDTRRPYSWSTAGDPSTVAFEQLPAITVEQVDAFLAACEEVLSRNQLQRVTFSPAPALEALDDPFAAIPKRDIYLDDVAQALARIDADDRDAWLRVGAAVHHQFGDEGRALWDDWSQTSPKFDPVDQDKTWRGFSRARQGRVASILSVFAMAGVPVPERRAAATSEGAAVRQEEAGEVVVPLGDLFEAACDTHPHVVDRLVPAEGAVTLLAGHGGTGKSLLALLLGVALVTGQPFLGREVRRSRVLIYSCEDGARVIRRRVARLAAHLGIGEHELEGLTILDMSQHDPVLYRETRTGAATTDRYEWLRERVEEFEADVLIIDNASDAFDGNEISRPRVRDFVRAVGQLVAPRDGAVVLLSHVDKASAKQGGGSQGYSGSTAWHNSARSRLYLYEQDGGLVLEHQKSNYGPRADPGRLAWRDGVIVEDRPGVGDDPGAGQREVLRAVLRLLADFEARGEPVSVRTTARNNAHRCLRDESGYPRQLGAGQLFALLREAERAGLVSRETYRTAHRKEDVRIVLTPAGYAEGVD